MSEQPQSSRESLDRAIANEASTCVSAVSAVLGKVPRSERNSVQMAINSFQRALTRLANIAREGKERTFVVTEQAADTLALLTDTGEHPSEPDERTLRFQATFWREQCQLAETIISRDETRISELERELAGLLDQLKLVGNKSSEWWRARAEAAEAQVAAVRKLRDDFDWQQDYAQERFLRQLGQALATPAQPSECAHDATNGLNVKCTDCGESP